MKLFYEIEQINDDLRLMICYEFLVTNELQMKFVNLIKRMTKLREKIILKKSR